MKYALGLDIGGTNIRIALVNEEGKIIKVQREPSTQNGVEALIEQIIHIYKAMDLEGYQIEGLGIGVPGLVSAEGSVKCIANLGILNSFSFKDLLKDEIPYPIYVGNDANVAALAEARVGSGKNYKMVQYITISTGIGGGLVYDGSLILGKHGYAQEIGSMIVNMNATPSDTIQPTGCIENEASGTALVKIAHKKGLENVKNAGDIFALANEGNKIAQEIKEHFISHMAAFIASLNGCLEPDIFVLGGGVMKSSAHFLDELKERIPSYRMKGTDTIVEIVPAKLDQDVGVIGAAMQCL